MQLNFPAIYQLLPFVAIVQGATTYSCLSGRQNVASDLPNCDYLQDTYNSCNSLDGTALNNCICTPQIFSAIFNCQSEWRLCLDSYEEDNQMQQVLSNWTAQCNKFITFTPSSPPLSTLTSPIPPIAFCEAIKTSCSIGGSITRACLASYTATSQLDSLSSCICQPSILSLASVCQYDGNTTCLGLPATLSNIDLWTDCPDSARPASIAASTTSFVEVNLPTVGPTGSSLTPKLSSTAGPSTPAQAASSTPKSIAPTSIPSTTGGTLSGKVSGDQRPVPGVAIAGFVTICAIGFQVILMW